jgi:hypothetical protein
MNGRNISFGGEGAKSRKRGASERKKAFRPELIETEMPFRIGMD